MNSTTGLNQGTFSDPELIFSTESLMNLFPPRTWRNNRTHSASQNHSWKNTDLVNEGKDCEWSRVVFLWDGVRLSVHTHTSVSQPPAQMLISTAVFLCVWTSFTTTLQHSNQTPLQRETWGFEHTYTSMCTPAQMSPPTTFTTTYSHPMWMYVCVPNCLHQHL